MLKSILNGLKHSAITLAVLILTAIGSAVCNFHPTDPVGIALWSALSAIIVGGITAVVHWLQNKDTGATA